MSQAAAVVLDGKLGEEEEGGGKHKVVGDLQRQGRAHGVTWETWRNVTLSGLTNAVRCHNTTLNSNVTGCSAKDNKARESYRVHLGCVFLCFFISVLCSIVQLAVCARHMG